MRFSRFRSGLATTCLACISAVQSQEVLPATCAADPSITTFSACDAFLSYNDRCGTYTVTSDAKSCFCHQSYVNIAVDCESELRLCVGNGANDYLVQSALQLWHKGCDPFMTFTPTSPVLSTVTDTDSFCNSVVSPACSNARTILSGCDDLISISDGASWTSCICQSDLIIQDYSCEFLGNTSCAATGATLSSLVEYSCSNFQQVIAAITPDISTTSAGPIPTILTATSPSPLPSTIQPTSTSTPGGSSSVGFVVQPMGVITLAFPLLLMYYLS